MSNFNPIERAVARVLSRLPYLKGIIKNIYSRLVFIKNKKNYRKKNFGELTVYADGELSSFFGYYDKSPENSIGLVLSYLTGASTSDDPSLEQEVQLAVFSREGELLVKLPINVHNWQQGSRAHWLNEDLFIYNDFDCSSQSYISRVYSVLAKEHVNAFDYPVQDSFQNKYFISLNYQRLMTLRPDYGYRNLEVLGEDSLKNLSDDGLWKIDFKSGKAELFISIKDVCSLRYDAIFDDATHKLNHVMISKDGSKFIFMHRYQVNGLRFDRLILANSQTAEMRILSDYGMVSHCFWVDNHTVLGFMRGPANKDAYWLIDVDAGEFSSLPTVELEKFGDGHPHAFGEWFVTDTYPDKARMQHLFLCNLKTGEVKEVGEFFHGFEFSSQSRCDLHPRLSKDGRAVYFDSVFSGKRQLYKMELPS